MLALQFKRDGFTQLSFDCRLTRQASLPSLNKDANSISVQSQNNAVRRSTVVARSPSSAKEVILSWVQERTNTYPVSKLQQWEVNHVKQITFYFDNFSSHANCFNLHFQSKTIELEILNLTKIQLTFGSGINTHRKPGYQWREDKENSVKVGVFH